jgi:hypothetical protein
MLGVTYCLISSMPHIWICSFLETSTSKSSGCIYFVFSLNFILHRRNIVLYQYMLSNDDFQSVEFCPATFRYPVFTSEIFTCFIINKTYSCFRLLKSQLNSCGNEIILKSLRTFLIQALKVNAK